MKEPNWEQFKAALDAFKEVVDELDVDWVAHKPIQGDSTPKVFAYRIARAVLNIEEDEK